MRGWVELDSPDPLKPLPTGWEKLNALPRWITIAKFWRNQLASLGSPVVSTRRRPIALKNTPVDSPYTPIVSTAIGSNWWASARAAYLYGACAPRRCLQLCQLPLLAYSVVPKQKYQPTCNDAIPNQTPTTNKREDCYMCPVPSI